jgi:hypothetical protein
MRRRRSHPILVGISHPRAVVNDCDAVDGRTDREDAVANLRDGFVGGRKDIVGRPKPPVTSRQHQGADERGLKEICDIASPVVRPQCVRR